MLVVIGLGANLGDRERNLDEGVARIARLAPILARSRTWESAPIGGPVQGAFLNAAVLIAWERELTVLLEALSRIESELGRVRGVKDGPRTLDLDILWSDGPPVATSQLVVPHPRLHERAFAVLPLLEVVPDAVDPRTGGVYFVPPDQAVEPHVGEGRPEG